MPRKIKELERMVRELCQASDILMKAICQRAPPEADKLIHNRDWLRRA